MSTLKLCEQYFGTCDIYKLLEISKEAPEKDIKKAYYKLSLLVHPDRVTDEAEKTLATEKFKVLSKIYQVLTDKDKRSIYDKQGIIIDDDDDEGANLEVKLSSWLEMWRKLFKPISIEDIENYEKNYIGSELERSDIKRSYLAGKGCINYLMNGVPFLRVEDEPRLHKIVRELIDAGELPEYKIFTKEPARKRLRRHQKYARESKEAKQILKKKQIDAEKAKADATAGDDDGDGDGDGFDAGVDNSLAQQIMKRRQERENNFDTLMSKLEEKYGGQDDSDAIDWYADKKKPNKKKPATAKGAANKKKETDVNKKLKNVKVGKVTKGAK